MPAHGMEVFDDATLTYGGGQENFALDVGNLRHLGILWFNPVDQISFRHALGNTQFLRCRYPRRRCAGANDAANHATQLSTRNASGHAANHS